MSDETFSPRGVREEPVRELCRREARTSHLVFRAVDGFEVALPARLLARAVAIGEAHAPLEWLGQLVGTRYRDDEGAHVVIEAAVRDVDARCEPHLVTSTPASEGRTRALVRAQYPDAVVVGWIHGHIRHGAQYSRQDFVNQATWSDPDSIGIVVDPWDPTRLAVYRGPAGERLALVPEGPGRIVRGSPISSPGPDAPSKVRSRRGHGWRAMLQAAAVWFLSEIASYTTGVWMGRVEARIRAFERQLHAAKIHAPAPPAQPTVADPRPDRAEAPVCRAPAHAAESARNARPRARMRRRDRSR